MENNWYNVGGGGGLKPLVRGGGSIPPSPRRCHGYGADELQKLSLSFGLEMNSAKTCMMVIDPAVIGTQSVLIDGKEIERVNKFKRTRRNNLCDH